MKAYAPLLLLAILLSFGSGYYALFIQEEPLANDDDISRIKFLKKKFLRTHTESISINLNNIYSRPAQRALFQPVNIFDNSYDITNSLYSTSEDCFKNISSPVNFSSFEKAYIWEEFRCGKRKKLNRNFVLKPPYLHPSGVSYAFLVYLVSNRARPGNAALERILPMFHIAELSAVQRGLGKLPGDFTYIADLDDDSMSHLIRGRGFILSRNYLFVKNSSFFNLFENVYKIYARSKFESFIRRSNYQVRVNRNEKSCFHRDAGVCWGYNLKKILSLTSKPKIIVLGMSVIILFLVVWQIFTKLKEQKFEDDKRRLALQVLTHEFRTPITSLLLSMENVNRHFDKIDDSLQEDILRISSDIYRLQRLTEMSQNYLKSDNQNGLVGVNKQMTSSVNMFIESIIGPYFEKVELTLLETDREFCLDEYWMAVCVKNLIENALFHGSDPVKVNIYSIKEKLVVSVSDAGECIFDSIDQLTKPFIKGNKSSGTGLGLNIVKNVVAAMGGSLSFKKSPTTFSITLKS
jgi:signal transduction histidine kinase